MYSQLHLKAASSQEAFTINLHAVSGIRGALLAFLPLLLLVFVTAAPLLVWGMVANTSYNWLWYSSAPVWWTVAIAIFMGIRSARRHTILRLAQDDLTLTCSTALLGTWTFSLAAIQEIETYDHTKSITQRKVKRQRIITLLLMAILVLVTAMLTTPVSALGLALLLFMGWLIQRAEQASRNRAGLILRLTPKSKYAELHRLHVTASSEIIQQLLLALAAIQVDTDSDSKAVM